MLFEPLEQRLLLSADLLAAAAPSTSPRDQTAAALYLHQVENQPAVELAPQMGSSVLAALAPGAETAAYASVDMGALASEASILGAVEPDLPLAEELLGEMELVHEPHGQLEMAERAMHQLGLDEDPSTLVSALGVVSPGADPATGLVGVAQQPQGPLSGKIVYLAPGHGTYWANGGWRNSRVPQLTNDDSLNNQQRATLVAAYLFNAGATIVPLRPIGHQSNAVVLDNDGIVGGTEPNTPAAAGSTPQSGTVTFQGAANGVSLWTSLAANPAANSGIQYFGDAGDVPYRTAPISRTETATAIYRPTLPQSGFYPVYAWSSAGADRAPDQLYRVHYAGGAMEVTVNHKRVGDGPVYLGTYYFEAGTAGFVEISNKSAAGVLGTDVVVADAIRFGNGTFVINGRRLDLEEMTAEYWARVNLGQGRINSDTPDANEDNGLLRSIANAAGSNDAFSHSNQWNMPIALTKAMNREADGTLNDRVYVSIHANGDNGRGAIGYQAASAALRYPTQSILAGFLGREIDRDLQTAIGAPRQSANTQAVTGLIGSPPFEVGTWVRRTDIGDKNDAEMNHTLFNSEVANALIEVGFYDNALDSKLMRDPKVTDLMAKAIYHAIVKYFYQVSGTGINPGDTIAIANHGWQTGDQVVYSNRTDTDEFFGVNDPSELVVTDIGGLTRGSAYFVIRVDQNHIQLALTQPLANAGTAIDLTSVGQGSFHSLQRGADPAKTFSATELANLLPDAPTNVSALPDVPNHGSVTVSWDAPTVAFLDLHDGLPENPSGGDRPIRYKVYKSLNGYGFDGGTETTATSITFDDLNWQQGVYYFRVTALNDGGESLPSAVVAARSEGDPQNRSILVINGFDRLDRTQDLRKTAFRQNLDLVMPRFSNSFDYVVQAAAAINDHSTAVGIATMSVGSSRVDLQACKLEYSIVSPK